MVANQPIIVERFKYDEPLLHMAPFVREMMEKKKGIMDMNFEHNVVK